MNKFAKQIEKAKEKGQGYATVRRDVVRRLIEKGEFHRLVCNHSYTDDYAWDAATNFGKGEVKDIEAVVKWLEQKTYCYIDVNNPNEVRILPYQGLSYSLFLEAPEPKDEDLHECEGECEEEALCDDKDVIDFTARLQAKKESEQMERLKESFFRMFGDQPQHVLRDIAQSIADKDEERYMELTEPIIMRKAIKHFNKGGF